MLRPNQAFLSSLIHKCCYEEENNYACILHSISLNLNTHEYI